MVKTTTTNAEMVMQLISGLTTIINLVTNNIK